MKCGVVHAGWAWVVSSLDSWIKAVWFGMLVSLTLIVERVVWACTRYFNPHGIGEISGWSRVSPLRWHPTLCRQRNWYAKMVKVGQRMHLWSTLSAVRETGVTDGWNGPKDISMEDSSVVRETGVRWLEWDKGCLNESVLDRVRRQS